MFVIRIKKNLIEEDVECKEYDSFIPKGFSREIQAFKVNDFISPKHRTQRKKLSHTGERVEINVLDSSDIHAAMKELRQIQEYLEEQFQISQEHAHSLSLYTQGNLNYWKVGLDQINQ